MRVLLRVSVAPEWALVEYVRAYPDNAESETRRTGSVSHRYAIIAVEQTARPPGR